MPYYIVAAVIGISANFGGSIQLAFRSADFLNSYIFYIGPYEEPHRFWTRQLVEFVIIGVMLIKSNRISLTEKYFVLLLKIYIVGSVARLLLLPIGPVLANRIGDIYLSIGIVLIPMLVHIVKQKTIGKLFVIVLSVAYLCARYYLIPEK